MGGIFIWGTGCGAGEVLSQLPEHVKIEAYVDSFPMADEFMGRPVIKPEALVGLTPELVDESLKEIKAFISKHYPEYNYEVFQCWSWLCDPQLIEILGEDTNISKFTARFTPIRVPYDSMPVFRFVFNIPHSNFKIEDLPENTTLERKLKKHFLSGKRIYGTAGYFLKSDVK